jgi:ribosomal-protein-alanine N-acetyltransferase
VVCALVPVQPMNDFPTLSTQRLRLREILPTDAPALFAIHSDAQAMRWFGTDPLTRLQDAEKLVEAFASWRRLPNPGTRWGIVKKYNGQFIGSCGLFKWNRGWKSCTLGYELASPSWGNGYMQEALSSILHWGFAHMALNRVEAQVHPRNAPSIKRLEALGFVREGLLRQAGFWLGEHHDLLAYSLLRGERMSPSRPSGIHHDTAKTPGH